MKKIADNHEGLAFAVPENTGLTSMVEVLHEPDRPQGTWTLAGGTIHHLALNTGNEEKPTEAARHIEGLGFTDISEQKDRNYFKSCYVRAPAARCSRSPGPCRGLGQG